MPKGGKRDGAGRKLLHDEKKITLCLTVTPTVREWLQSQEINASEFVEQMVRKSRGFKGWVKARGE